MFILNILLFTALLVCIHAHQPAELFDAFEEFLGGLLQPSSVMASGNSSALATDCVGRISFMTLRGIENNTEFLYGISSKVAQANTTQIVGYPTNITVESLSIQKSVVSASTVFWMNHATSSPTTPLQVDFWIYFDDGLKISEYDLAVRNLGKAFSFLSSTLSEQISNEIIVGNSTDAASAKMAVDVCTVVTEYCTGANQQYDSYNSCYESLGKNVTIDNLDQSVCRYIFKDMAQIRPDAHCSSLGIAGGENCVNRDYIETATSSPFSASLIAANLMSGGSRTAGLSDKTLTELMKFNMQLIYPTTVAFYSIPTFLYILLLYMNGKGVEFLLARFSMEYRELSFAHKRNVVAYILSTIWTIAALILQLVASPSLGGLYTWNHLGEVRVAGLIVSGLYLYELVYRSNMRWTLLVHHLCTLFAIIFIQIALQMALDPAIASAGLIWLFQATTEQSIFIGLVLYRLRYAKEIVQPVLRFAAIQSFIFKFGFTIYLLVWWAVKLAKFHHPIDIALNVVVVLILSSLMATQVQGSYAVWCIANNMGGRRTQLGHVFDKNNGPKCSRAGAPRVSSCKVLT